MHNAAPAFSSSSRPSLRPVPSPASDVAALEAEVQRLRLENEQLKHQLQKATTFAHRAAHDIKGPARKIAAFAQMVSSAVPRASSASVARAQQGLDRNVDELRKTIDTYLLSSVQRAPATDISLDALLDRVLGPLRAQYPDVDVTRAQFGQVRTHPTALLRILHNVLENAFKFDDRDNPTPHRVHIDGKRKQGVFVLSVDDNGCGQLKSRHHPARGTGVGLSSLSTDLHELGATLALRDWPSGTRVEVRIPLLQKP